MIGLMSRIKKAVLFIGDIAILYAALAFTLLIRYKSADFQTTWGNHLAPFSVIFIIWLLVLYLGDLYRPQSFRNRGVIFNRLIGAVMVSGLLSAVAFYLFGGFFELTPKTNLAIFAVVFFLINLFWRTALLNFFRAGGVSAIMLGDSPLIEGTVKYLKDNPHTGYRIVKWVRNAQSEEFGRLAEIMRTENAHLVIVQPKITQNAEALRSLYRLLPFETNLINFSDFYELIFEKVSLEELEEGWFVEHISTHNPIYDSAKRIADFLLGIVAGIVLLPFTLIIAILTRLTSRGPVIYKQERTGKGGQGFMLYKFRTMQHGNNGALWTEKNDVRITAFGKLLRLTHLDEIPQIWNIIRGDIAFTGPRPERIELTKQYERFPYYEIRQVVKPGLTGWAQINYQPSASLEEAYEKLKYDIYYVKNRSLALDMLIILRTIKYFFTSHS
jgi:exopolysaccharide biosynthesis polyprenyl glycosylphosphotransferase